MTAVFFKVLEQRVASSELGKGWVLDPLMHQDTWSVRELGFTEEQCLLYSIQNIKFDRISLPWLNYLTKLVVKARLRENFSLPCIINDVCSLTRLNIFLVGKGYTQPIGITDTLLTKFITSGGYGAGKGRRRTLIYAVRLWAEEGWLDLSFTPPKIKQLTPKVETVPEEVLYEIYKNLELLPAPLERLFRLQLALGCRISELLLMPRACLKQEGDQWLLLRWIAKQKHWQFYYIHPLVAELVQEQQRFLNNQFGDNSTFNKLFCKLSTAFWDCASNEGRFKATPVYHPKCIAFQVIPRWLHDFSELIDLKDKYGNRFKLASHMFRRTKAMIMAYCETEDEYIAAVLGHGTLDMLPHYRKRSLERLEKESKTKGYVDVYGRLTTHKPRKQRYEKLATLLKVTTPLGECHRPAMLGDCQYRYACLSCMHHRVTLDDKPKLQHDQQHLLQDLKQAQAQGHERRVTEIQRLLELINARLRGLDELQGLNEEEANGITT